MIRSADKKTSSKDRNFHHAGIMRHDGVADSSQELGLNYPFAYGFKASSDLGGRYGSFNIVFSDANIPPRDLSIVTIR